MVSSNLTDSVYIERPNSIDATTGSQKADDPSANASESLKTKQEAPHGHPSSPTAQTPDTDHLIDWDGPSDHRNPQNWSKKRKWYTVMVLAGMTFVVSFGSSVWSAAVNVTAEEFNVSQETMILGVTLYVVGFALGELWSTHFNF